MAVISADVLLAALPFTPNQVERSADARWLHLGWAFRVQRSNG
jgi:hypothetical protein